MSSPATTVVAVMRNADGKDTAALVRKTPNGIVRNMLTNVQLRQSQGHVYQANIWNQEKKVAEKRWALTASGYFHLNQFAGVSFATPETLLAPDGRTTGNPHITRNEHGEITMVKVRRIGVGRNAVGNMIAVDLTVTLDLATYFAQDVWSQWARGDSTKPWGVLCDADTNHAVDGAPATGRYRKLRCPGGVVLALDLSHMAVIKLFGEHINRQKFAERYAITVCERNILKKFLAVTYAPESLIVPVVSWQTQDRSWREVLDVAEQVAKTGNATELDAVERETVDATKDDLEQATVGDADEENRGADPSPFEAPTHDGGEDHELATLRKQTQDALNKVPVGVCKALLRASGIATINDVGELDRDTCLNIISECTQY